MGPVCHGAVSAEIAGTSWAITDFPAPAEVAVGVGILVDKDNLGDFYQ